MARRFAVSILSLAVVVTSSLPFADRVMAAEADRYTLPFFNPAIGVVQGYLPTHTAIDYGMAVGTPVAAARAGTVVDFRQADPDAQECLGSTRKGNFVLLRHADGRTTVYLHLMQNGVSVTFRGQRVSAGEKIGLSGNSGKSCGPHLQYQLNLGDCWDGCGTQLNPAGNWTTADPGKVPWHGNFEGQESYPNGYTGYPGFITTVWVKFRNDGGRTWSATDPTNGNGHILLASVTGAGNAGRDSPFYVSGDWESPNTPGRADQASVAPNGVATFTFGMKGPGVGSYYDERFNLAASGLFWFDYYGNPGMSGYWLGPIYIVHCC